MRNPYIVGRYVRGKDFYGRSDLIDDILSDTNNAIWIIGKRRIGKTSLLRQLEHITDSTLLLDRNEGPETSHEKAQHYIAIFCDLQGLTTIKELSEELFYSIEDKKKQFQNIGMALSSLEGKDAFHILRSVERASRQSEINVLLLLDEAEALIELGEKDPLALQRLRKAMQQGSNLKTILAATKALSKLNDLCREWKTSPFLFGFASKYIAGMSDPDADNLIRQTNQPKPIKVALATAEKIKVSTGNEPFLIQRMCERLFQSDGSLRSITDDDLILDEMLADFFQIDYNHLSPTERMILRHFSSKDKTNKDDLLDAATKTDILMRFLQGLCSLGYVKKDNEEYSIANHFLKTWLQTSIPKEINANVSDTATMDMHDANRTFITDQPLTPNSAVYIEREQDDQIIDLVNHTNFIVLLGPKQIGKTSLLFRLIHRLKRETNFKPIYVDISQLADVPHAEWYKRVCETISKESFDPSLHSEIDLTSNLEKVENLYDADIEEFKALLEKIADKNSAAATNKEITSHKISKSIIILDGVNVERSDTNDQNVIALREIYHDVIFSPEISQKFTFILAGSFDPCSLIASQGTSSFKTSHELQLDDFNFEGVKNLTRNLSKRNILMSGGVVDRIYYWTNGHPYLTQKLCSLIEISQEKEVESKTVDMLVSNLLSQGDEHINYIINILRSDNNLAQVIKNMLSRNSKLQSYEPSNQEHNDTKDEEEKTPPQSPTNMETWQTKLSTYIPILTRTCLIKRGEDNLYEIRNNIYKKAFIKFFYQTNFIGEYELIEELGTGGQGTVYKAKELSIFQLEHLVALKVLKLSGESAIKRFEQEVRAVWRISHPNIIKIFRVGKHWEKDSYFFVMECFDDNLANHIGNGKRIPPKKIVELIIQVVDALKTAHESNILHRDIKPGNILLDKTGRPILSDFGCAVMIDLKRGSSGTAVGTYPYMAPEQIENASQADQRSDLYSIGVILFEAITGRLPFEAKTISELKEKIEAGPPSVVECMNKIEHNSRNSVEPKSEAVPDSLNHLISKLLEKAPENRYQSSQELLHELKTVQHEL